MNNTAGVYKIINLLNGRCYVGQAQNFRLRKNFHWHALTNNKHGNSFLQRDFNKCGSVNFMFEIILETDCIELLNEFEQSYLNEYWDNQINCYNISSIAYSPARGLKRSEETKVKMRLARSRQVFSDATRKKISESNKGKLSGKNNPFFGKTHTKETIEIIVASNKKRAREVLES